MNAAMNAALNEISDLLSQETGIMLPAARQTSLRAALRRAAPEFDSAGFLRATSDPACRRDLLERLIDEVTIKETTFLRDRGQLQAIDWHGLLRRARDAGSRAIRVWSVGCASGEEPYTLALLAQEAFAPAQAPVDVLGTDIAGNALVAAAAGRYRERAVQALEAPLRGRYLDRESDGSYLVGGRLRELVRFRRHNLAKDPIPPAGEVGFDLIACRNVLIYFRQELVTRVIEALERSLHPGGMLLLGAADALKRTTTQPARAAVRSHGPLRSGDGPLRRPLQRKPPRSHEQRLTAAIGAADRGDRDGALTQVATLLADNPLDAEAHFVQGLVLLEAGDPASAAAALRRALFADASFALAAFTLGRAYDVLGDGPAARRCYEQVLRTLHPEDHGHDLILRQVDLGDIAAACRVRLGGWP